MSNPFLDAINSVPDSGSMGSLPDNFSFSSMPQIHGVDLSGIRNSYNSIPAAQFNNALSNQMNNAWSSIPQIHGVDLSGVPAPVWNDTPADFAPGFGSSGSSNSGVQNAIAQSQHPGFWGSLWNGIKTVGTDIGGILKGTVNPALQHNADLERQYGPLVASNPNVALGAHGLYYKNAPQTVTNPFAGIARGLQNPQQSIQQYHQNLNTAVTGMNPFADTMIRGVLNTATSPLTYVPFGTLGKVTGVTPAAKFGYDFLKGAVKATPKGATVAKDIASEISSNSAKFPNVIPFPVKNIAVDALPQSVKDIAQDASLPPYAAFNWQSALGKPFAEALTNIAPNGVPVLRNAINGGEKLTEELFKPLGGARDYLVNGVSKLFGANQSDRNTLTNTLQDIFKGTTPEQRATFTNLLESTKPGTKFDDPTMESLRQKVEPFLDAATQKALSKGLIDSTLNPEDFNVGRYLPHIRTDKLATDGEPLVQGRLLKSTIDASNARTIPGTIADINAKGGTQFENDALKVLGYHLDQLNRASNAKDLIDSAMSHGLPQDTKLASGETFPGTHQKATTFTYGDKSVLLPESEAKYLKGLVDRESVPMASALYRGGVNLANRLMFLSNPLIHPFNNLGWQALSHVPQMLGPITHSNVRSLLKDIVNGNQPISSVKELFRGNMFDPSLWKEAFTGVRPGSAMDQALQNGALHLTSEIGSKGGTRQFVSDLAKSVDNAQTNPFKDIAQGNIDRVLAALKAVAKGYVNSTPAIEKIYRTVAFQRALSEGMTPEGATSWVRSIFGGNAPGTESAVEHKLTSVMPFFNWTKTAIGSNVKNFAHNPVPASAALNAMDAINQQNTNGNHFWQNKNPLSIALGTQNAKGLNEFWEPYFPALDPLKLGSDIAQNGIWSGPANFAFSRMNPFVKFPLQMVTKELNPAGLPPDKRSVMPSPDIPTNSTFNTEPLFGNSGPMVPFWESQLMQDIPNPFAEINRMNGESNTARALTNPFASFSGTISAPNAASNAKHAKYLQGQQGGEIRNFLKRFAQQVQAQ